MGCYATDTVEQLNIEAWSAINTLDKQMTLLALTFFCNVRQQYPPLYQYGSEEKLC